MNHKDIPKKCQADVDQKIRTASCNCEHTHRWDYSSSALCPSLVESGVLTQDCDEDQKDCTDDAHIARFGSCSLYLLLDWN
jgi:hypothetical protein